MISKAPMRSHDDQSLAFMVAGRTCRIDAADAARLAPVFGPDWRWTSGTSRGRSHPVARLRAGGRSVMLPRLVLQAGEHDEIGYRNGDSFDLRRANLTVRRQHRRVSRSPLPTGS